MFFVRLHTPSKIFYLPRHLRAAVHFAIEGVLLLPDFAIEVVYCYSHCGYVVAQRDGVHRAKASYAAAAACRAAKS